MDLQSRTTSYSIQLECGCGVRSICTYNAEAESRLQEAIDFTDPEAARRRSSTTHCYPTYADQAVSWSPTKLGVELASVLPAPRGGCV